MIYYPKIMLFNQSYKNRLNTYRSHFACDSLFLYNQQIIYLFFFHCVVVVFFELSDCLLFIPRHNKIHEKEQKYQCPHCPFTTRLSFHLQRHLRLHTGAKPYGCPHCKYKCNSLVTYTDRLFNYNIISIFFN